MRNSVDYFVKGTIPLARLVLCGGIVGASSAGLLTHSETLAAGGIGALIGAAVVVMMKLAHIL